MCVYLVIYHIFKSFASYLLSLILFSACTSVDKKKPREAVKSARVKRTTQQAKTAIQEDPSKQLQKCARSLNREILAHSLTIGTAYLLKIVMIIPLIQYSSDPSP